MEQSRQQLQRDFQLSTEYSPNCSGEFGRNARGAQTLLAGPVHLQCCSCSRVLGERSTVPCSRPGSAPPFFKKKGEPLFLEKEKTLSTNGYGLIKKNVFGSFLHLIDQKLK